MYNRTKRVKVLSVKLGVRYGSEDGFIDNRTDRASIQRYGPEDLFICLRVILEPILIFSVVYSFEF